MQQVLRESEVKMKQAVDNFRIELKQLRTGRASPAVLEGVTVEYYGAPTPLNQTAAITVPEATLLAVQPFDPSIIGDIEKAILKANLGLNPSNDGKIIRVPIPPLTEERRKELVRKAHDMAENTRNSVRGARREGNEMLKKMKNDKEIGEDDEHRGHDEVQKLHDHYISEIGEALEAKEKDILTV